MYWRHTDRKFVKKSKTLISIRDHCNCSKAAILNKSKLVMRSGFHKNADDLGLIIISNFENEYWNRIVSGQVCTNGKTFTPPVPPVPPTINSIPWIQDFPENMQYYMDGSRNFKWNRCYDFILDTSKKSAEDDLSFHELILILHILAWRICYISRQSIKD